MDKCSRKERTNFTILSNELLRDNNLSYKAKGLVSVIMGLPKNWDFSVKGIASISKEGETSVRSSIRELIKAGFCAWQNVYENNKIKYREYYFSDEKADVQAQIEKWDKAREERKKLKGQKQQSLDFGKLDEENLNEGNLNEGNRNQINNIKNNIKKDKENNKEKDILRISKKLPDFEEHEKYYRALIAKYPRIMHMMEPFTYEQGVELQADYTNERISEKLQAMENWEPLKRQVSAIKVLKKWLEG